MKCFGLTSAFRSERILTTHLLTAIWKVKLMTPLIFSKASSQRLLRACCKHNQHYSESRRLIYFGLLTDGYRIIEPVDLEHHSFGPFVRGAQEELSFPSARGARFRLFGLCAAGVLQDLVDLRGQQFGLAW